MTLLDRADEVRRGFIVAFDAHFYERSGSDDVAIGGVLEDDCVAQYRLELADPRLVVALLVLGRVVVGVLPNVTVFTGAFEPLRQLFAVVLRPPRQLLLQPRVRGRREVRPFHATERSARSRHF